jgi:hypothetical protein
MNLGDLRTHFKALLNRTDVSSQLIDTFLDQSQTRIMRTLRVPNMEKQHTYTISASTSSVVLPADFLEAIDLYFDDYLLRRIPMREMLLRRKSGESGNPHFFARENEKFLLFPAPSSGTLTLNYYATFATMSADSDENGLAQMASDVLLYGALVFAADYYLDDRLPQFEMRFGQLLNEIQLFADDAELAGQLTSIRPTTFYDD